MVTGDKVLKITDLKNVALKRLGCKKKSKPNAKSILSLYAGVKIMLKLNCAYN